MLYSSSALSVTKQVKEVLAAAGSSSTMASRRVETSDPAELDETYLVTALGLSETEGPTKAVPTVAEDKKPFARPKRPGRRR